MAPVTNSVSRTDSSTSLSKVDPDQTLRAAKALVRKLQTEQTSRSDAGGKTNLLADADVAEDVEGASPIWLILTTKKHVVDKKRLKPGKITLPHPYLSLEGSGEDALRICLITADPQRKYKDLVTHPSFPLDVSKNVKRVIGLEKLKAKYNSYESKRKLLSEYDVFLADDRVITYLPTVLGKVFYKSSAKRPVPVHLEGRRQNFDDEGNKRRKLSEGGTKVTKSEPKPVDIAAEIKKTLSSALVHLAPSTTTAVKVGTGSMTPAKIQENIEAVVQGLVETYVPQKWRNVRAVHIKGPNTVALPIWLAEELWTDEQDVLDEPLPPPGKGGKKRKRGALTEGKADGEAPDVVEVPGPDGKIRKVENPAAKKNKKAVEAAPSTKKNVETEEAKEAKKTEKAEKEARKQALKKQKAAVNSEPSTEVASKPAKKARMKAAELI